MCYIIDAVIPAEDLECLKRLGEKWNRDITFVAVFHPDAAEFIEKLGFGSSPPVKVKVRIEVQEEETEEAEPDEEPEEEEKETA